DLGSILVDGRAAREHRLPGLALQVVCGHLEFGVGVVIDVEAFLDRHDEANVVVGRMGSLLRSRSLLRLRLWTSFCGIDLWKICSYCVEGLFHSHAQRRPPSTSASLQILSPEYSEYQFTPCRGGFVERALA